MDNFYTVKADSEEDALYQAARAAERDGLWITRAQARVLTPPSGDDIPPGERILGTYLVKVEGDALTESELRALAGDR